MFQQVDNYVKAIGTYVCKPALTSLLLVAWSQYYLSIFLIVHNYVCKSSNITTHNTYNGMDDLFYGMDHPGNKSNYPSVTTANL